MALSPGRLAALLARFRVHPDAPPALQGGGHINDSYLVTGAGPDGPGRFLLQRLNPHVFPDGAPVITNGARVAAHLAAAVRADPVGGAGWRVPEPLHADDGVPGCRDADGAWWRVFPWLDGVRAIERVGTPAEAFAVGRAFGRFHAMLADFPGPPLVETLPGFHDTPARLAAFDRAVAGAVPDRLAGVAAELAFVETHRVWVGLLAAADLPCRVVHNDAKAGNVLLDAATGEPVAVIDLDTVMMGTLLHDVGDLIRSGATHAAEDAAAEAPVAVDVAQFTALVEGFAAGLAPVGLAPGERGLFVAAGLVITFEQGLRFLADHLAGDRYYRIDRPGQNLDRARVQFRLAAALGQGRRELERIVAAVFGG